MRWIIGIVVVVVVGGVVWFMRDPLMGLISPPPAQEPAPEAPQAPANQTYASSTLGISLSYPPGYILNESYTYPFGSSKVIHGVSLTIPPVMATGTNLSADTRISLEQLPRATTCSADIFILDDVKATTVADGGVEYSLATTSGAGAGNLYEEAVYAIPGSTPCSAVRYYIHSTNIGNYEPGAVQEFDRTKLLADFDAIRRSLLLN